MGQSVIGYLLLNKMKQPQIGQQPKYGQQRLGGTGGSAQYGQQSFQSFQPRPSGAPLWRPQPPQLAAAAPSVDTESVSNMPPSALDPQVFEQFMQYLASNPTAMSASMSHSGIPSSLWILDSGASHHMSPYLSLFASLSSISPIFVKSASDTSMSVEGVGSINTPDIGLTDVYYIPKLALNLVSVSQLCKSGHWVFFSDSVCVVQDQRTQRVVGIGRRLGELYVLEQLKVSDVPYFIPIPT